MKEDLRPIAVVGLSCRLPGGVSDPQGLWELCSEQRDVWQSLPNKRMNNDVYYHPDPGRNGTSDVRGGYFLAEDPALFDAKFFNLTETEARAMDPQQRMLLELSYQALENAGIPMKDVMNSDTAVYIGSSCRDYADLLRRDSEKAELYQATGIAQTMLSNRISYFYNLKGPSVTIDTACSSSLVALHLACSALRSGDARIAIVGGSNLILNYELMIDMGMLRFLSPDGRSYAFDNRANGFGRGEGAACLVLKPLEDALQDGDTVRAVIRNSGTNQDGKTAGISMPSGDAQMELMRTTYAAVGLDPVQTAFVEAHGTGTPTGDPIEAASLAKFIAQHRSVEQPLMVGSIKSNIGHLEGASGIASVLKAILMLENGLMLPNHDFQHPNVNIPMKAWNLQVPMNVRKWPTGDVRRVSVNNFGFGGSNAHVVIEDARGYRESQDLIGRYPYHSQTMQSQRIPGMMDGEAQIDQEDQPRIFLLSSFDELSGKRQVQNLRRYLKARQDGYSACFMRDLAYTLNERRSSLPWKQAFTANSVSKLIEALNDGEVKFTKTTKAKNIGFVFTGQGASWHAMGRDLIAEHLVFRKSLDLADQHLQALGATWSLYDELMKDSLTTRVRDAALSQPLTTIIQIALVDLLDSWGIRPTRVTGHSSGEIAAAYCSRALTQKDAIRVAFHRGIMAEKLGATRIGAMIAVGLPEDDTRCLIESLSQGVLKVACVNSPSSVTVSGDREAVLELSQLLHAKGAFKRELAVDVAYHSHHMGDVADEYLASLSGLSSSDDSTNIEFYSSVTGKHVASSQLGAEYWVSNMVDPVQFSTSVKNLLHVGDPHAAIDILLEIGPHSTLQGPIRQILQSDEKTSVQYKASLIRNTNAIHTLHECVAFLVREGCSANLGAVNGAVESKIKSVLNDLPPYPWDHSKSYWAERTRMCEIDKQVYCRSDLIGVRVKDSISIEPRWRNIIRAAEIPWVNDHIVQSSTLYPAAGFLAMAIEAGYQHAGPKRNNLRGYRLREISIGHALIIPQDASNIETLISLQPYNESMRSPSGLWSQFNIYSSTDNSPWTEHCRGLISVEENLHQTEVDGGRSALWKAQSYRRMVLSFKEECVTSVDGKEMYQSLDKLGLNFGPTFMNLRSVRVTKDRSIAEITIPNTIQVMPAHFEYPFIIHPATLDSCIHALFPINDRQNKLDRGTPVPTFIEELFVSQDVAREPGHVFDVCAQWETKSAGFEASNGIDEEVGSLTVFDHHSTNFLPKILIKELTFKSLPNTTHEQLQRDERRPCYKIDWQPDPSLLSPEQAVKITAAVRTPLPERDQTLVSQQAAFYYAELALSSVKTEEVMSMHPHHRKLYATLTSHCDAIHKGHWGHFCTYDWVRLNPEQRAAVCAGVDQTPYGILLRPVGENLAQILRQELDPLSIMVENNRLERYYRTWEPIRQSYQQAAVFIKLLGHKNPHLNILEVGAGTGGASLTILEALDDMSTSPPNFRNYDFTDISPAFFEKAAEKLVRWTGMVKFLRFDAERDPLQQGFKSCSYDLIVAANVIHATSCIERTLKSMIKLLKPGGTLVLVEVTVNTIGASLMFGTLPGWWNAEEESRQGGPLLTEKQWDDTLRSVGMTGANVILWDMPDPVDHQSSTIISTLPMESSKYAPAITIVTDDEITTPCSTHLKSLLMDAGFEIEITPLLGCNPLNRVCIVLSELTRPILRNPVASEFAATKRMFLESQGVLWVTEGALMESSKPDMKLVTGLARTVRVEKGDTAIITFDLDALNPLSAISRAEKIFSIFMVGFGSQNGATADVELEYVERGGTILIPRILEDHQFSDFERSITQTADLEMQLYHQESLPLRAEVRAPGFLDSIRYVPDDRISGELPDDEVEVQVKASGFNFRDVMTALGQISAYPLGCEYSGVVSAIGKSVHSVQPGDSVVAMYNGCFCNTIRAPAVELERIPPNVPHEVIASLPIVYSTAYLAVFKVARLSKGETVLVHAGAGGLGQALINLCQLIGATIFATVGTLEKKRLLVDVYNIPEENIFSSRDNTFISAVMEMTKGRGVDVIMNSLSGEALRLTWNCIAPYGRFVELGKRDFTINNRLEMRNFERNVSFTGLDLMNSSKAERKQIMGEILALYGKGSIKAPVPITAFGASEMETALRLMQSGKHMGKLVLSPRQDEQVKVTLPQTNSSVLRADASYLLVGGLGGIGRAIALWMLNHGAKNFIFASRSGSDRQQSRDLIAMMEKQGARVFVSKCDIGNMKDLDRLLQDSGKEMPLIRGMIHGALVVKADFFARMKLQDYNDVMRPKVDGIWNLHERLSKTALDFFIMLSSLVGISGDPSQAAYVSASAFQDAFADFRNHQGLPAVALDLGVVIDIGFIAEENLKRKGVKDLWSRDIREPEIMAMVKSAIITPRRARGSGATIIGLKDWTPAADPVFQTPFFSHFRRAGLNDSNKNNDQATRISPHIRQSLKHARSLEEAARNICAELIAKTSSLLLVPMEDISSSKSMSGYGMDSLIAVEMRNWLLREMDAALPVMELMSNTSLQDLSKKIARASKLVNRKILEEESM